MPPGDDREQARGRNDAMLNGALIVMGALGVFDNVVVHWLLDLHRAVEGSPYSLHVEIAAVVGGGGLLLVGLIRERRARRALSVARAQ